MKPASANAERARPALLLVPNPKLRLRDQVREVMRFKHYAVRTEETYWGWIRQFVLFLGKRHPKEMGATEVHAFLTHLAAQRDVAAATQSQALNALVYPRANQEWCWQSVFPADKRSTDPQNGGELAACGQRSNTAGWNSEAGDSARAPTFLRHSSVGDGYDIRTVQDLLGHKDVATTQIHTHVMAKSGAGSAQSLGWLALRFSRFSNACNIERAPIDRVCETVPPLDVPPASIRGGLLSKRWLTIFNVTAETRKSGRSLYFRHDAAG